MVKEKIIHVSGKRKTAIARATLYPGTGKIRYNHMLVDLIQPELLQLKIKEPLMLAGEAANKVNIDVKVIGGGINAQAEAARLAIGRALVKFDSKLQKTFLDYDRRLLVADIRQKEARKPNDSRARAARQKSYR